MPLEISERIPLGQIKISQYVPYREHPEYGQNVPKITDEMQIFASQYGFDGKITAVLEYHPDAQTGNQILYPLFKINGLQTDLPAYPGDILRHTRDAWPAAWARFERMLALEAAIRGQTLDPPQNHQALTLQQKVYDQDHSMPVIAPLLEEVREIFKTHDLNVFNLKPLTQDRSDSQMSPLFKFVVEVGTSENRIVVELPNDPAEYNLAEEGGRKAWQTAFDRLILQLNHLPPTYINYLRSNLQVGISEDTRRRLKG